MSTLAKKQILTIKDTAANLAAVNRIYPAGWLIIESDTDIQKEADGQTPYSSLTPKTAVTKQGNDFNGAGQLADTALTGLLANLTTTDKTNLVAAINELRGATLEVYSVSDTNKALLEDTSNWDANGTYIGTELTGSTPGQSHYLANGYKYECVPHATLTYLWIRMPLV